MASSNPGDSEPFVRASVPHFQEPGRVNPAQPDDKIPDATYGKALDYLVIACVDLVFLCKNQILLIKRNRYPRCSWWIVGGRMSAGENPQDAASRKALQEAGLDNLHPSRFKYVGVYSTCFAVRHQAPEHHGSHTLNVTYSVELTPTEKERIDLQQEEHSTWRWVELNQVENLLDLEDVMDQALLKVIKDSQQLNP
jgi:ADP-ribose pyrophosphatase YjhB (NUDIX family)